MTVLNVSTSQERGTMICLLLNSCGTDQDSDGNIRYFEYAQDKFEYLSEYKSADPQRGLAFLPKRGLNIHDNEVMRAFKTVNDGYVEPVSFIVPRRAEVFQGDIYPPVPGTKPAMSAKEWFDGKDGLPPKIDLESVYAGEEPAEVPADYKPVSQALPTPRASSPPRKEPEPEPVNEPAQPSPAFRSPPPSMKQQTASIANMASKFADKDDVASPEDDDDSSSFEEIPKPVDRSERQTHVAPKQVENTETIAISKGLDHLSDSAIKSPSPTAESTKVCHSMHSVLYVS